MKKSFAQFVPGYIELIIRFRWIVILITILGIGGSGAGLGYLEFSTDYRVYFSDVNPELTAFEDFQETYTKNDNIVFVVKSGGAKVFTPGVVAVTEKLTQRAWSIPYTIRVDSVTNFQHSWADGDDLTVEDLIVNGSGLTQAELDVKEAVAFQEPFLFGNLISKDGRTTGVNVTLQIPQINTKETPEAVAVARQIIDEISAKYPDVTIVLAGFSMLNNAFSEAGENDIVNLIPLMYGILLLSMILILRSISATFSILLVIGFSSIAAMGIAGYSGVKLTPVSITAPTIIMTIAIADSIHILVTMLNQMRTGQEKVSALKESLRVNLLPVTVTSLTTVVGFLALNFSDSPPFWHLGNITAVGIVTAWLLSLVFLPAMLTLLPIKVKQVQTTRFNFTTSMGRLADFVIFRYRLILISMSILALVLVSLIPGIQINDQWVEYFDQRIEFRNDAEFAIKNLNGPYGIEYSLPAAVPGGISSPGYLKNLEGFTAWLRTRDEVTHVFSYSDLVKRLNKNLNADDEKSYLIPESQELAAQYLLLYELSLPYGLDLNDRINIDKSATRVTATLKHLSTSEVRAFFDVSESWIAKNLPDYMHSKPTGATVMFAYISERNIDQMINGNIFALILIGLIMILIFRSFCFGVLTLIPNAIPILAAFGLWALIVGQVGLAAAMVTSTSLGIVVDDTVHFFIKYLRARREKKLNKPDSIRYVFETVGPAIVITSIILATGFLVLATSTFLVNSQMGLLTAITILIALLVDLLLLPSILLIGYKKQEQG